MQGLPPLAAHVMRCCRAAVPQQRRPSMRARVHRLMSLLTSSHWGGGRRASEGSGGGARESKRHPRSLLAPAEPPASACFRRASACMPGQASPPGPHTPARRAPQTAAGSPRCRRRCGAAPPAAARPRAGPAPGRRRPPASQTGGGWPCAPRSCGAGTCGTGQQGGSSQGRLGGGKPAGRHSCGCTAAPVSPATPTARSLLQAVQLPHHRLR